MMRKKYCVILTLVLALKLGHLAYGQRIDVYKELLKDGNSTFLNLDQVDHYIETLFEGLECDANQEKFCDKVICYNATDLISAISGGGPTTLEVTREQFSNISILLMYHIHHLDDVCHQKVDLTNITLATACSFLTNLTSTPMGLFNFLAFVKQHLHHHNHSSSESEASHFPPQLVIADKCLSVDAIHYYLISDVDLDITQLATFIIYAIYEDFEIQDKCRLLPKKDDFVLELLRKFGNGDVIDLEGLNSLMETLGILPASNTTSEPTGHDHRRKRSNRKMAFSLQPTLTLEHSLYKRSKRQAEGDVQTCFSPSQLMAIFDSTQGADKQLFEELCPALLHQKIYADCSEHAPTQSNISNAEKYGYGTIAVFIICLCSVLGLIIVPCASKKVYNMILSAFVGLAVGTLFADAILHLIPMAMGLHDHSEDEHSHEESNEIVVEDYVKYGLVIIGGLYFFYILELIMENFGQHSHSHGEQAGHEQNHTENSYQVTETPNGDTKNKLDDEQPGIKKSKSGFTPLAVMIILGDGLHNLADGLAIGAAFSSSISVGVGTSIAVFCHELPHELGDFAVLIKSGMTIQKALGLNFLSALTAFIGLYVGIAVSSNEIARLWIFAITAGMFIYIALVDLMPLLIKSNSLPDLVLSNLGILTGIAIMLIIAIFEEKIKI